MDDHVGEIADVHRGLHMHMNHWSPDVPTLSKRLRPFRSDTTAIPSICPKRTILQRRPFLSQLNVRSLSAAHQVMVPEVFLLSYVKVQLRKSLLVRVSLFSLCTPMPPLGLGQHEPSAIEKHPCPPFCPLSNVRRN